MRIASQIPNSDQSPLYDVRNPARASNKDATCEVMFRGRYGLVRRKARRRPMGYAGHASPFGSCMAVPREARRAKRGGARRDRTDDLMLAKHALSQLSYGPVPEDECFKLDKRHMRSIKVVGLGRLELPTSRLSSARSNQLSYKPLHKERARAHRLHANASHKRSPWRVFVREERETKTAKSRQWSSTIWRSLAPDVSKTIR